VIPSRNETFSINYEQAELTELFVARPVELELKPYQGDWLALNSIFPLEELAQAEQTLLLAAECLDDPEIFAYLQVRADAGVRVYLLLGDDDANRSAIEALSGRCLVRTGVEQSGALLLADHGTDAAKGFVLSDGVAGSNSWLRLNAVQRDDYYRLFCHLFWERAVKEYMHQGHAAVSAVPSPLGLIDLNHQDALTGKLAEVVRQDWSEVEVAVLPAGLPDWVSLAGLPLAENGTLICELSQMVGEFAASLCNRVASVILTEQEGMPQVIQGAERANWFLPKRMSKDGTNWCVRLSKEQVEDIAPILEQWRGLGRWEYRHKARVAELNGAVRFTDNLSEERTCTARRDIQLEAARASSFDDYLWARPEELVADQIAVCREKLAHEIDYTLEILPPIIPANAIGDPLHAAWTSVNKKWVAHIEELEHRLSKEASGASEVSGTLAKMLGRFIAALDHRRDQLRLQLRDLKKWDCTQATSSTRVERLYELNSIAEEVADRAKRWDEKVAEAEQQQAWEQTRRKLEEELRAAHEAFGSCESNCSQTSASRPDKLASLESKLRGQWLEWLGNASTQLEGKDYWSRDKFEAFDVDSILTWISEPNKQLSNSLKRKVNGMKENYAAGVSKLRRDMEDAENRQEKAKRQVDTLTKALDEHGGRFTYNAAASDHLGRELGLKGGSFNHILTLDWPEEDLPQAGTHLVCCGQERWLVITSLDQLEAAREDASRLGAHICSEERVSG
tara:strand:- start:159 stop:2366 length:2208 start_codon:yes stop_codon:yes gene_type:complete